MDGILNILKPSGMTSHDVVSYIRRLTGIKKVGHTGTLDPGAIGVLPICLGRATKAAEYITEGTKKYRTEMKLGVVTDTGDKDGTVITSTNWKDFIDTDNLLDQIQEVIKNFSGQISQVPPMYSAVKIDGKKLYELARKGQEIERKPRNIEIYELKIIEISGDEGTILFDVTCSKGTYIRVLCEDIGKAIGCGAHMSYLIRMETTGFNITDSYTLEQIEQLFKNNKLNEAVVPIEIIFNNLPKIEVSDPNDQKRFMNGMDISINANIINDQKVRIYFYNKFIAIANVVNNGTIVKIKVDKFFSLQ